MAIASAPVTARGATVVPRTQRERQVGFVALACLAGVVGTVVYLAVRGPATQGDRRELVRGAAGIADCLRRHRFTNCNHFVVHTRTGALTLPTAPYPLLQYIPAVALQLLGASRDATLRTLTVLSGIALIA